MVMVSYISTKVKYQLHGNYAISVQHCKDGSILINLYCSQLKTHRILLNNHQCSKVTNQLCETTDDFYDLLIDILSLASVANDQYHVSIENNTNLKISFPIYFGSRNRTKIRSFQIEFYEPPSVTDSQSDEATLDPQDWTDIKSLGHQIMDDMMNYLRDVRTRPPWRPTPTAVQKALTQQDLPQKAQPPKQVYDEIRSLILPYPIGNIHPKFWGWTAGSGSPIGILAELIAATMNTLMVPADHANAYVDHQILTWMKMIVGFPTDDTTSGVFVTGTSVATMIAFAVARKKFQDKAIKVYCSTATHFCVIQAAKHLGCGENNIIEIPVNEYDQINLSSLESVIDMNCGGIIIGSAGTTARGAIDDLNGLADICARDSDNLWFHVDGAIGGMACCSPRLRPLFKGIERADSIAFDLHKWLSIQYDCGCILTRHKKLHNLAFQHSSPYITRMDGGITPSSEKLPRSEYGFDLSRGAKALKVWMTFKCYGIEQLARIMEKNVEQAQYLISLLKQYPNEFELLSTSSLPIINFRYIIPHKKGMDNEKLNAFNKRLLITIQESGIGVVSPCAINKEIFTFRMCIVNHRTKRSDIYTFVQEMLAIARVLAHSFDF